jgi:hypothetical protein
MKRGDVVVTKEVLSGLVIHLPAGTRLLVERERNEKGDLGCRTQDGRWVTVNESSLDDGTTI